MRLTRRGLLRVAGGAALLGILPTPSRASAVRIHTGPAFGSAWRLILPPTNEATRARTSVETVVARVDALMSPFRNDSELTKFNKFGFATVSPETEFVAQASLDLARDSDGAFDPTLAPLSRRYGFGFPTVSPDRPIGRYSDISVVDRRLNTSQRGLSLDLCGIAKGFALDQIIKALEGLDFLIELGGEVAARGRHPSGRRWRVGIRRPETAILQRIIEADRRAVATSGVGAQGYNVGARRYAHILDSRTADPVNNAVASVSVLAPSGLIADGLATAATVLGPEAARPLLKAYEASALFLLRRPGGLKEVSVNRFLAKGAI